MNVSMRQQHTQTQTGFARTIYNRLAIKDIPRQPRATLARWIRRYRIHRSFGFLQCPDEHPFQTEAVNHDSII